MMTIKTAYPNYYHNNTEIDDAVNLWGRHLADDDFNLTVRALDQYISNDTAGFPPAIGQIKDIAKYLKRKQREEDAMLEQQKKLNEPEKIRTPEDKARREEFMEKMRLMLKEI